MFYYKIKLRIKFITKYKMQHKKYFKLFQPKINF